MSVIDDIRQTRQTKPITSLTIIIATASILTLFSFLIFWNSETRNTVQSIQRSSRILSDTPEIAKEINNDGVLTTSELRLIQQNLLLQTSNLDPSVDFDEADLDAQTIGY